MKLYFVLNGEYVSRKTFADAYGKDYTDCLVEELRNAPIYTTITTECDDEVGNY